MENSCARHFMILFRDHRLLYRALYTYSTDSPIVEKIHGMGPLTVDESMIEKFYKYNSGNRSFVYIPAKRFSIQCDAFIIQDEYWHKRSIVRR
ncbi:hypothetical protein GJ496_002772 [Pomphorhynchus laevis]|nr:hypothetical protein GJ496_002772 [Pomphorhynchus laevis]